MSNKLLTTSEITNEALMVLSNTLNFTRKVNRQYDDKFGRTGAKIGQTINIRKPIKLRQSTGAAIDIQGANENFVPLTLSTQYQRAMAFTSVDKTLSLDEFSERIIKPAIISMANQIDYDGLIHSYQAAFNQVGTPGSVYTDRTSYNQVVSDAKTTLSRFLAPMAPRTIIGSPEFVTDGASYNNSIFNPQNVIGEQYLDGTVARALGFDWYENQSAPVHTVGTYSGTPKVNGGSQAGGTLNTDGWGAGTTLNIGDVFTIAGVFTVNAQTKANTGVLQKFVVTAKNAAGTSQALQISPAIVGPEDSQQQNVSALPADNADITVQGASGSAYKISLAMHTDAFVFGCADLDVPTGGVVQAQRVSDSELGLSIRFVEAYDIRSDQFVIRFDLLGGWGSLYPELATRIVTA